MGTKARPQHVGGGVRARLRLERAELARLRGDEADRRRLLVEAERLFGEMGATGHAERVAKELATRAAAPRP